MKIIKTTLLAALLAACVVFAAGCGSSDSKSSKAESSEIPSVVVGSDAVPTESSTPASSYDDDETALEMSRDVAEAALEYCDADADNGDTVELQKTDMAQDGIFYHFVYVHKGSTVIPLVISADAKLIYEPTDYFAEYGIIDEEAASVPVKATEPTKANQ